MFNQLFSYANTLDARKAILGVVFALLFALSAGLGLASRQNADAMFVNDAGGGNSVPVQAFGTAPEVVVESFGSAPEIVTQSFGDAPETVVQSFGSAPSQELSGVASAPPVQFSGDTSGIQTASFVQEGDSAPVAEVALSTANPVVEEEEVSDEAEAAAEKESEKPAIKTAATLPTTGPGQVLGLFTGTSLAGFLGHKLYLRRRS